jgi:Sulfotransferase family
VTCASRPEPGSLPNLFIVGVPKAGTTSLHHYLAGHPDVFMTRVKELYHFSTDLRVPPFSDAGYLDQFGPGAGCRWLGESTPLYLVSEDAAGRIARFNPMARIIMLLREPIEMMHALHGQHLADCVPCERDFETELRSQEAARRRGDSKVVPGFLRMPRLLEVADYTSQIRRFQDHFPTSQIRVILFDDFIKDPQVVHAELLRWLGLPVPSSGEFPQLGSRRAHVDPAVIRAVRSVTPITRCLRRVFPKTVDWMAALIRRAGTRKLAPLDPAVRARLQAEFFPDFSELESLIGRSLEHWRLNPSVAVRSGPSRLTRSSTGPDAPADALRK